jgi:hypothetical protein
MNSVINVCGKEIRVQGRLVRIGRLEADLYHFLEDPVPMLEALQKCGTRIDLFTFMQRLPETSPKYNHPMEWDNLAAMPITTFDEWWKERINNKTRNMVRRGEKNGLTLREVSLDDELARGMWEVYNETEVRQGRKNRHHGKDVETVYREEATFLDSSIFIGAYLDGNLIGFIKLVYDETRTQACMMNFVCMVRHRDKAPANALVAQAVKTCVERGISYLAYSRFAYGKIEQSSLNEFKERNGFKRVDLPRYYVPLTVLGRVALRLRLHHRLTEHLPAPVVAKLRELRAAWYDRKLPTATGAP